MGRVIRAGLVPKDSPLFSQGVEFYSLRRQRLRPRDGDDSRKSRCTAANDGEAPEK